MKLSTMIQGNRVIYFSDVQGTRIIVLEARFETSSDLPRLYKIAQDMLNDIQGAMCLAA